jgi:hypothetical protein
VVKPIYSSIFTPFPKVIGLLPGGIRIPLPIKFQIVVAGLALPPTGGGVSARHEELTLHRIGRELLVSLDFDGLIALGDDGAFPHCFCHNSRLDS